MERKRDGNEWKAQRQVGGEGVQRTVTVLRVTKFRFALEL